MRKKFLSSPTFWAAVFSAVTSFWGVRISQDINAFIERYRRTKDIAEMMQTNINELFVQEEKPNATTQVQINDDIAKAKLRFISLYILAEEDEKKLYFARIAAASGKQYFVDLVSKLITEDFPEYKAGFDCNKLSILALTRFSSKKEREICKKVTDIAKTIEPNAVIGVKEKEIENMLPL